MSHQVWTASCIDSQDRFDVFVECVKSVYKLKLPHYISICNVKSFEEDLANLCREYDNIVLYIQDSILSQFEQLLYISRECKSNLPIIFLDDDDIITHIPKYFHPIGLEYVNYILVDFNSEIYTSFIPYEPLSNSADLLFEYEKTPRMFDFSGICCTVKNFKDFISFLKNNQSEFENFKLNICDILFCAYLKDILKDKDELPYIFKRTWNPFIKRISWSNNQNSKKLVRDFVI